MNVRGEVFIAWGGNFDLATAVAEELKVRGYVPQVGGVDNDPGSSRFFLGDEVMAQLRRAPRAIVLAAASRDADAKAAAWLRPNLMFEWGMLAQRLPPAYLHVFLIGMLREELPSDLRGSWAITVEVDDLPTAARVIAEDFVRRVRQMAARPLEVLVEWPFWKAWIHEQVSGRMAPDNLMLAGVLLHSIQPSFYFDDHVELRELLPRIATRANLPMELMEVLRIASAAWSYYAITGHRKEARTKFKVVYDALIEPIRTATGDPLHTWMDVVRLDFLALTVKQLADTNDNSREQELLKRASALFNEAASLLETLNDSTNAMWLMWMGYVRRNWGVVLGQLGDVEAAKAQLGSAIASRRAALSLLNDVDPILSTQLLLEVLYAENDLAKLGEHDSIWSLEYAIELLTEHKPPAGRLGVWNRARRQLMRLCLDASRHDLNSVLEQMS